MKIYVINGNTNTLVSQEINNAAQEAVFSGTEIITITPEMGPSTIEGYMDGQISAIGVCEMIAKYHREADAFVLACFSDPGLYPARELTQKPIVGIAEASMVTAVQLGHLFSLLTPLRRLKPVLRGLVHQYGFMERLASIRHVDFSVADLAGSDNEHMDAFSAAGTKAIDEDDAEVLILSGAVLSGKEKKLTEQLNVPVLDPVKCAVAQAQALVQLGLETSHHGGFSKPFRKDCSNCPEGFKDYYQ